MKQFRTMLAGLVAVAAVAIGFGLLVPQSAAAATYNINTTADEDSDPGVGAGCSLYEAGNALSYDMAYGGCPAPDASGNTIVLPSGNYSSTDGFGYYGTAPLTIRGAGIGSTGIVNDGYGNMVIDTAAAVTVEDFAISCVVSGSTAGLSVFYGTDVVIQRLSIDGVNCADGSSLHVGAATGSLTVADVEALNSAYLWFEGNAGLTANNLRVTGGGNVRLEGNAGSVISNLLVNGSTADGLLVDGIANGIYAPANYMSDYMNYVTTVNNVTISNSAQFGINHSVMDKLYINNANIHHNDGGGLLNNEIVPDPNYPPSTLYLNNSYVHQNGNDSVCGGGISNQNGHVVITNTTIASNTAYCGGGIFTNNGITTITDGTADTYVEMTNTFIFDNTAEFGGAIAMDDVEDSPLAFNYLWRNSTIAGNHTTDSGSAAIDIYEFEGDPAAIVRPTLVNMLLANGDGPAECFTSGTHLFDTASTHNIAMDDSCGSSFTTKAAADIKLASALTENAGPTAIGYDNEIAGLPVLAILAGSAAQDAGTNENCPATDARGFDRPAGPLCDVGAYELPAANEPVVPGVPDTGFAGLSNGLGLIVGGLLIVGAGAYALIARRQRA